MKKAAKGNRSFPGRLTLEQWWASPLRKRIDLIWRAQCDLLDSSRCCANKRCRRHRTCSGDARACWQGLSRRSRGKPKALWREWARLDGLQYL